MTDVDGELSDDDRQTGDEGSEASRTVRTIHSIHGGSQLGENIRKIESRGGELEKRNESKSTVKRLPAIPRLYRVK